MKNLFSVVTVACILVSLVCVSSLAAATKEQDEQMLNAPVTATEAEPTATEAEPTATDPRATVLVGDANGDGVINMKDVLTVRKYLADLPVEIDLVGADMTRDDAVNMKDVLALRLRIAYDKDAGEDEVPYEMLEDVGFGYINDVVFNTLMKRPFLVRKNADVTLLNTYSNQDKLDETKYTDEFFAENALLLIPHITDTHIETLAALERLSDNSVYLRYDLSNLAPPWNHVSFQLVKISAKDGAAIETIVSPSGEQTVSYDASFIIKIKAEPISA